jgi:tetratricopeptide (TPR) repeat protein
VLALTRIAGVLACLTLALPARAQEETSEAKELFDKGVKLYKEGQHAEALEKFQQSYEIRPHWRLHLNIGLCYMEMSMYTRARAEFDTFIKKGADELDEDALELVNAELAKLDEIVAILYIETLVEDALIELDGTEIAAGSIEVDPGFHVLKASRDGDVFFKEEFLLSKADRRAFTIGTLPEEEGEEVEAPPVEEKKGKKTSPAVWVMSALTVALTATAVATGAVAVKKHGDVEQLDSQATDLFESGGLTEEAKQDYLSKRADAVETGKALGYATTAFIAAAGASLAATIVVAAVTRSGKKEKKPVALSPVPLESGGMLVVSGSF